MKIEKPCLVLKLQSFTLNIKKVTNATYFLGSLKFPSYHKFLSYLRSHEFSYLQKTFFLLYCQSHFSKWSSTFLHIRVLLHFFFISSISFVCHSKSDLKKEIRQKLYRIFLVLLVLSLCNKTTMVGSMTASKACKIHKPENC